MNKNFKGFFIIIVMLYCVSLSAGLYAGSKDIVVQLRLYEAVNESGESSGVIVSSYYLKKISERNLPLTKAEKEKESIKKIYKLKHIKKVAVLQVILRDDKPLETEPEIKLNNRVLAFRLFTVPGHKDRFGIKILRKDTKKVLMESEIIVPHGKSAVIGFKDSSDKIYFLAFNRKKSSMFPAKKSVTAPRLLKISEPEYPGEALKKNIESDVIIAGRTDNTGKVIDLAAMKGHPLFIKATKEALEKWKYSPWKIEGINKPVVFTVIIVFQLEKTPGMGSKEWHEAVNKRNKDVLEKLKTKKSDIPHLMEMMIVLGHKKKSPKKSYGKPKAFPDGKNVSKPKLIRRVEPEYPGEALKKKIEGAVFLYAHTDPRGNVNTVKVLKGDSMLGKAAAKAALKWKYTPWKIDGKKRGVHAVLVFIFRLKTKEAGDIDSLVEKHLKNHKAILEKVKKNAKPDVPMLTELILIEGKTK